MQKKIIYVAVIGAPNAGKSSLVNNLVGQKVSIVSPKVQTTRFQIMGIAIFDEVQAILIDTPGIFDVSNSKSTIDKAMISEAFNAKNSADCIFLVIDAINPKWNFLNQTASTLLHKDNIASNKLKLNIIINKIDLIKKPELLKITKKISDLFVFENIFMISALKNDGINNLIDYCKKNATSGEWDFNNDEVTNISTKKWACEITREQIFLNLNQELPYEIFVENEAWEEFANGDIKISQAIVVSKENYKSIVLGKNGSMLKKIGQNARLELENNLNCKIHLKLFVKLEKDWQTKNWALNAIGIQESQ